MPTISISKNVLMSILVLVILAAIAVIVITVSTPAEPKLMENEATTTPQKTETTKTGGAGGTRYTTAPPSTLKPQPPHTAAYQPSIEPTHLSLEDACSLLTPLKISQLTGIEVDQGVSRPSGEGSVCEFNSNSGSEVVLEIGRKADAPSKSTWTHVVDLPGVGDETFYQAPDDGSANGLVVKGEIYAQVWLYRDTGTLTEAAVKNMLTYLAGRL